MNESSNFLTEVETLAHERIADFNDPRQEWRRLSAEFAGTFFLVVAAAGAPMVGHAYPGPSPSPWLS